MHFKSSLVAWAAVGSKAVVLLLLIYCLMYFPLFVGVLCLYLFCYALLCVHSSFAIILKKKRKLVALLLLSYRCIVTINVLGLFLTVSWVGLQYSIVVFPDHTHLLFGDVTLYCQKSMPDVMLTVFPMYQYWFLPTRSYSLRIAYINRPKWLTWFPFLCTKVFGHN